MTCLLTILCFPLSLTPASGEVLGTATVTAQGAGIYVGEKMVQPVKMGEVLTITAVRGEWYGVSEPRGWVHRSAVRFSPAKGDTPVDGAMTSRLAPGSVRFVDAGGRFSCVIPREWQPQQRETAVRSKVSFRMGRSKSSMTIIVRETEAQAVGAGDLQQFVNRMRQSKNLKNAEIDHQGYGRLDGCRSVELTAKVGSWLLPFRVRTVKYRKHGYDHVITLGAPAAEFESVNRSLDRLLGSYRSVERKRNDGMSKEKKLPTDLDYELE